jgi:hypothetical protein
MSEEKGSPYETLDAKTRAALEEGLRLADADPKRWTPEQVRTDAQRAARERNPV